MDSLDADLERLLIDLTSPLGPEVFAGFGSPLESARHDWQSQGLFEAEAREDEAIRAITATLDVERALAALLDIASRGPESDLGQSLRERRRGDWDHALVRVLSAVGERDRALFWAKVGEVSGPGAREIVNDVRELWEDA